MNNGGAGPVVLAVILWIFAIGAYWAPTIVAIVRRKEVPNMGSVIVINFFAVLLIPWIVALAMAVRSAPRPAAWVSPPYNP